MAPAAVKTQSRLNERKVTNSAVSWAAVLWNSGETGRLTLEQMQVHWTHALLALLHVVGCALLLPSVLISFIGAM